MHAHAVMAPRCDSRRHHRYHRHHCRHGGTSVGVCTATHVELRQCASGAELRVVASGARLGAEPSAEPGAKPRARPRGQCSVVRVCSSITSTIFKLVTDTPFSYQNRHQKPWRACAASNHIFNHKKNISLLFLSGLNIFTLPQIAGAPDLRSSVSYG